MILGGDFNAGCTYLSANDWPNIRLRTDSRFLWTIPDSVDSTVTATNCPYDRMVLAGNGLRSNFVSGSAIVYRFDTAQGISNQLALDTSDHYPVDIDLR